jgi:two-component system chemotaxis response regulator CheB
MARHDIVVIGASAGGVEALSEIAAALPADLAAAVFCVLHLPATGVSALPLILSRAGPLPAEHPWDGEPILPGRIYVAPPDLHMMVEGGTIRLVRGPRENRHRPAVDPLFRRAALHYGERAIGVVLTGSLDDGTAGLLEIKRQGGFAIVQDPDDALFRGMPESACRTVQVDRCLPLLAIGPAIVQLVAGVEAGSEEPMAGETSNLDYETRIAAADQAAIENDDRPGIPSPFGCPECGGVLWEIDNDQMTRYRCRVGHAYSPESLLASQSDELEAALWAAMRGLEEKASLTRRLAERAREQSQPNAAERFEEKTLTAETHAGVLRSLLLDQRQTLSPANATLHELQHGDQESVPSG